MEQLEAKHIDWAGKKLFLNSEAQPLQLEADDQRYTIEPPTPEQLHIDSQRMFLLASRFGLSSELQIMLVIELLLRQGEDVWLKIGQAQPTYAPRHRKPELAGHFPTHAALVAALALDPIDHEKTSPEHHPTASPHDPAVAPDPENPEAHRQ